MMSNSMLIRILNKSRKLQPTYKSCRPSLAVSQNFETLRNPNPKVKDYVKGCQFLMTPTLPSEL